MKIRYLILALFIFVAINLKAKNNNTWHCARGDQSLSGYTSSSINPESGILHVFDCDDEIKSTPVVSDNKIVTGTTGGNVFCIDFEGKLLWKQKVSNAVEASALIIEGKVFIGDLSGVLYAFDLESGNKLWEYKAENQIMGAPNWFYKNKTLHILIGSYDFYLHCVNAETGTNVWKYELENYLNGTVSVYDNKAIFGGCDGFIHAVDLNTGKLYLKYEVGIYMAGSPVVKDNSVIAADYEGGITCVNIATKTKVWSWKNPDSELPFIGSPAIYKDKVVIGGRDKHVYCLNNKTGKLLWKTNAGFRIDASLVIAENGALIANMRGDLLLLNIETGNIEWTYELGSPIFSNPAVQRNGIITGASDGNIYIMGK
ncbi:PQQ-binding-like beta-propeller repeat protein [Bacteroidales bacterium]|nr:PQQ-binding-like beta-propeller repeat protein [Bacteroidales bacterium]